MHACLVNVSVIKLYVYLPICILSFGKKLKIDLEGGQDNFAWLSLDIATIYVCAYMQIYIEIEFIIMCYYCNSFPVKFVYESHASMN